MKRSEINAILRDGDAFIRSHGFRLPPFAHWSPLDWKRRAPAAKGLLENHLGWDITDFGSGNYERIGLFLFTVRNGSRNNLQTMKGKIYAEKIMIVGVDQVTPLHFHWSKTEDIINRGGGTLVVQLFDSMQDGKLAETEVNVSVDGLSRTVKAGGSVGLDPGESITLPTRLYHKFWGVDDRVLVGEVSTVNDDTTDNRFFETIGRFPTIEEDEPPLYLLCSDYARFAL